MMKPAVNLPAVACLLLVSTAIYAEAEGPDFFRVTQIAQGDTLIIRSAPSAKAHKLGDIPPDGSCIRNLGCQGGLSFQDFSSLSPAAQQRRLKQNPRWCKVEYRGITGWVAGVYLTEGGCP
jgi:hypothetical protein